MTVKEIIEYLYDNNVRADITIEQMAEDLADRKTEPMMTNLEWLKTLSAEELADWFYDEWLHHLQYRWSSSRGGLIIWLKDRKTEPSDDWICTTCKHHKDSTEERAVECRECGDGGHYERKEQTEPSNSEKPNNYCDDCLYTDTCDSKEFFYACTSKATISKMEQVEDEPQTERSE